jgi:hypothetical protein
MACARSGSVNAALLAMISLSVGRAAKSRPFFAQAPIFTGKRPGNRVKNVCDRISSSSSMTQFTRGFRRLNCIVMASFAGIVGTGAAGGAVTVIGVQYQPDQFFPEDNCLWHDRQYPGPCSGSLTGQVVKVFLKNTGSSAITVNDATLAGRSLNTVLKEKVVSEINKPRSIYYANLSSTELQALVNAGEPVWWKADPPTVPPGGVGQMVLRLRYLPVTQPIAVGVLTSGGNVATNIAVDFNAPRLASVGFAPDRRRVYLHWRRAGGAAPVAVFMDGDDVTGSATTVSDPALNFGVTVLSFDTPLANMSFHSYQGVFADGKRATGALRTWVNPFLYGTWAAKPTAPGEAAGMAWVNEAVAHGVNCVVMNINSDGLSDLMKTPSGRQWMDDHGYGVVKDQVWDATQILRLWFIRDEPDGADATMPGLPAGAGHNPGVLAMQTIAQGEVLRAAKSDVPVSVNIDGNLKPYNYWNWAQVPDVFMTDPYYQPELADAYWNNPQQIPLYAKATQVYATARTTGLACEPNPLHVILYSCKQQNSSGGTWPFPAPGTKRTEVYYALAGGAKGMAYWWYKLPDGLAYGNADALALWKEIGLLGNEIKTVQPLLVISHPVTLPTAATSNVWVRTLAAGADAMIFLVVNDNHYNDAAGFHYTAVPNATITATLPAWLAGAAAFEVKPGGLSDVNAVVNGTQMQLNLGTLNVTKLIVVTTNPQLRSTLQARYVAQVWPGVCSFAPEYCAPQTAPPSITIQPSSRTVAPGATVTFSLVAAGSDPLYYRWQRDGTNLNNGGAYSGVTGATLTVSNAAPAAEGGYRCVVTNAYGAATSSVATLTVTTNLACGAMQNPGFEEGFTLYGGSNIGNDWTQWSSVPNTITGYDETGVVHGGAHAQRLRVWNTNGGTTYAGVYQRVAVTAGVTYTNTVWMYAYDTNSYLYLGVDPTGGTDPTSGNVVWSAGYNAVAWAQRTWTGAAAADHLTIFYRVRATDNLKRNGYFDDAALTCPGAGGAAPNIVQSPGHRAVTPGSSTSFGIVAGGSEPLYYQWQKNSANLANDGHYSGANSPELEINGVNAGDAATYRCIVTNVYGSATSSPAVLTVVTGCNPVALNNGDFEGGHSGGVASGWTAYQRAPYPGTVWSIQTASPPDGGLQYQQIANTSSAGGAGVRQDVTGCIVGATYNISGWMRGNSGLYSTCRVKVSPTASTDWATAVDLNPPQVYTGSTWVPFSGTVVATGTNLTLWLDGQTGGSGLNKAECFDGVTVSCVGATVPPIITDPPQDQRMTPGGTAVFTVGATGSDPLSYQWQKNQTNLLNAGHYSGVTTPTLTITGVDANDAGSYRCVVTNNYGSDVSSAATLTVTNQAAPCLAILNADFEDGFTLAGGGYIGSNWTEWEQDAGAVVGYDETGIVHGGAHAQRVRVWGGTNGSAGGVYQQVPVVNGQPFSVSLWMNAGEPLTACYLGVDAAGGTNAAGPVSWSPAVTNTAWELRTVNGVASADHLTVFCKVATPDNAKRNGYFDDASPASPSVPLPLSVQRSDTGLTLLWPECPNARLERAEMLGANAVWTTVTNVPAATAGWKRVTLPLTEEAGFFRLALE